MTSTFDDSEISQSSNLKLSELFDEGMALFDKIEDTREPQNSPSVQEDVKRAMHRFEVATKLVSLSGLFSANERMDEIPSECLQYLLLPALLGSLSLKITIKPRKEVIEVSEIYFRDFLRRCKDYEVTEFEIPPKETNSEDSLQIEGIPISQNREHQQLTAMILNRDQKIKRYKEQKELKEKIMSVKKAMESEIIDESAKRDYFLTTIKFYINQAIEEIISIETEKPILEYMANREKENKTHKVHERLPVKPLKPIIIAKDEVQKAIFGLGYPSLPTLTVKEFYDQRVKEGTFPGPQAAKTNNVPAPAITEDELKELAVEQDDPEALQRAREMDEYKDDHRRGWGNRYNRS